MKSILIPIFITASTLLVGCSDSKNVAPPAPQAVQVPGNPAPKPTPAPMTQTPTIQVEAEKPAEVAQEDTNKVGSFEFPKPNPQSSDHPMFLQPKEPVLEGDGSLLKAYEDAYK